MRIRGGSSPTRSTSDVEALVETLISNSDWSGNSEIVSRYETKLCEKFGAKNAIATSSGTAALHASLYAVGVAAGCRVIFPAVGAVMTVAPALALQAIPHFVDVMPSSFVLDPEKLLQELRRYPIAAIVSCGLWGNVGCNKDVVALARDYGVPLIEDAAQSIGAGSDGQLEGFKGDIGCFSTHDYKMICTGEGGFVLLDNCELAEKIRSFVKIGFRNGQYGLNFGLNYKLSALQAAAGLMSLEKFAQTVQLRRNKEALWLHCTGVGKLLHPLKSSSTAVSSGYAFVGLLPRNTKLNAASLAYKLYRLGVQTDYHRYQFRLLQDYDLFSKFSRAEVNLKNAEELVERIIVLPTHDQIAEDNIPRLSEIILDCIAS